MSPTLPAARVRRQVMIPLRFADGYATRARVLTFDGLVDGLEHLALGLGGTPRRSSRALHQRRCPWSGRTASASPAMSSAASGATAVPQLREAVERIAEAGGYLLYLRQEGRGIGLYPKLDAYGCRTRVSTRTRRTSRSAMPRTSGITRAAAQMLAALDVTTVALLSNNPDKAAQLSRLGVTVTDEVPTGVHLSATNAAYLATKAWRGGHTLSLTHSDRRARGNGSADRANGSADRSDGQAMQVERQRWIEAADVAVTPEHQRSALGG